MAGTVGGTGNRILLPVEIAAESLYLLWHAMIFARIAGHHTEPLFNKKVGDTITIKRPFRATTGEGENVGDTDDPMIDRDVEVTINKQRNFHFGWNNVDATLRIQSFGRRYLRPAVQKLALLADKDAAVELAQNLSVHTGTPGDNLSTLGMGLARAHAEDLAQPNGMTSYAVMSSTDIAYLGNDVKSVHVPDMVEGMIRRRIKGEISDYLVLQSSSVPSQRVANHGTGTPTVRGANQQVHEGGVLNTTGWQSNQAKVLNKGQLFTIDGVREVKPHYDDEELTGYLATFCVAEDASSDASGHAEVKITNMLNAAEDTNKLTLSDGANGTVDLNAWQNVDNSPANGATINVLGEKGASYRQAVLFDRDALEFVNVVLAELESANWSATQTEPETYMTVSLLKDIVYNTRKERIRGDILYGTKCVYPDLGQRIWTGKLNV